MKIKFNTLFWKFALVLSIVAISAQIIFNYVRQATALPVAAEFIVAGLVGVAIAFVFAMALAWYTRVPIKMAINALLAIKHGDKVPPIEMKRYDELGKLIHTVNQMMNRDEAVQQANEDPLTGLANRRSLTKQLDNAVASGKPLAVVFIDLDGFKPINDTYGHEVGDEALIMVAERLTALADENDVVCRLGGDEFVLMFNNLGDRAKITEKAEKVLEVINQPYWIGSTRVKMGASLGISVGPEDGKTGEELLAASDESMYAAKQGGKNAFRFYS